MLIIKLQSGLGNNMFQYAAARTIAENKGFDFCYNSVRGIRFYYKNARKIISRFIFRRADLIEEKKQISSADIRKYFDLNGVNLFKLFYSRMKWLLLPRSIKRTFTPIRKKIDKIYSYEIYDNRINRLENNTELFGSYQSVKYFEENRESVIDWFSIKKKYQSQIQAIENNINSPLDQRCCVHVRRGDQLYQGKGLAWENKGWSLPIEYYKSAISNLPKNLFYVISTDSPEYVEDNFKFLKNKYISRNNPEVVDMGLFGVCKYNIIANSSFSWWGAWLNKIKDKFVISPMYYMGWAINTWVPISFEYHPKDWFYINVLELISKKNNTRQFS